METNELLEHILDLEWDMFVAVKSAQPASCQSSPDKFRAIRESVFGMWSDDMLASYLIQLSVTALIYGEVPAVTSRFHGAAAAPVKRRIVLLQLIDGETSKETETAYVIEYESERGEP